MFFLMVKSEIAIWTKPLRGGRPSAGALEDFHFHFSLHPVLAPFSRSTKEILYMCNGSIKKVKS